MQKASEAERELTKMSQQSKVVEASYESDLLQNGENATVMDI